MRVLIIGGSGMLGHTLFSELSLNSELSVYATIRGANALLLFPSELRNNAFTAIDSNDEDALRQVIKQVAPQVVINAVGLIRQLKEGNEPLPCIEINARFPHILLRLCRESNARLIHYSTDCVFDGHKGSPYTEEDTPSAKDIYGLSKYLGELRESPALTIRTSIIGHELRNKVSLVEWFLAQQGSVKGYRQAIYTGLPTCEHARILTEYVFPNPQLVGLYQVSAAPISKFDLLTLIAQKYGKDILITPDDTVIEDKRLSGERFSFACGYLAPAWERLVANMHSAHQHWKAMMV